jgi:hypothetical protein
MSLKITHWQIKIPRNVVDHFPFGTKTTWRSKQSRSSSGFCCFVNWPDWNVTIIFRFFQRFFKWQPKRCFNADGKYVLMLLSVVM